jgi:DsbC/DsbD-like thiol-disulfide interchange protein
MLAACAAFTLAAPPQSIAPGSTRDTPHLSVVLSSSVAEGGKRAGRLFVDVTPKPRMHVYAPGEKDGIPIEVTLDANPAIKAGKAALPPPQKYFFPPLKLTQLVYSSPFRITLPITILRQPPTGALTVTGTLQYQACDDAVCYVPKRVPVTWTLTTGHR